MAKRTRLKEFTFNESSQGIHFQCFKSLWLHRESPGAMVWESEGVLCSIVERGGLSLVFVTHETRGLSWTVYIAPTPFDFIVYTAMQNLSGSPTTTVVHLCYRGV